MQVTIIAASAKSDRRLSAKLLPTFTDRRCHVVYVMDTYGHILGFLDRSRYFFFQVAPQLYSGA
jgi:CBS-domain-containing membrane protein